MIWLVKDHSLFPPHQIERILYIPKKKNSQTLEQRNINKFAVLIIEIASLKMKRKRHFMTKIKVLTLKPCSKWSTFWEKSSENNE